MPGIRERFTNDARIENSVLLEMLGRTKIDRPIRTIPPLHYQLQSVTPEEVMDIIGISLGNIGFRVVNGLSDRDRRIYSAEDRVSGIDGKPISIIRVKENNNPNYLMVRSDGLNQPIMLPTQKVVTANLVVANTENLPPSFIMIFGSGLPLYDAAKRQLFDLTKRFPLVDDVPYRGFVTKYAEMDNWLITGKRE